MTETETPTPPPDPTAPKLPVVKRLNQRALMAFVVLLGVALWALVGALTYRPKQAPVGELPVNPQDPRVTNDMLLDFLREANRKAAEVERGMEGMKLPPGAPPSQTNVPFPPPPEGWEFRAQPEDTSVASGLAPDDPYATRPATPSATESAESLYTRALASPLSPASFSVGSATAPAAEHEGEFAPPAITLPAMPEIGNPASVHASPSAGGRQEAWLAAQDENRPTARRPRVEPATGALLLRAGTLIPAVLQTALSSDLPGQAIAIVRRPVYDTDRGESLLIPQGARLLGRYDSRVVYGQRRMLLAWTRLVLPDGSALDLPAAGATDGVGRAGLGDKVNNHFARLFGSALLLSAVSAGAQLSQPDNGIGNAGLTASEIAWAAVGQEMARVTSSVVGRELDVPPTLEVRPGFSFNVEVATDLLWPRPWSVHPLLVSLSR